MKRFITLLLLLAMLLSLGQSAVLATTTTATGSSSKWPVTRTGGNDRIETANLICRLGWEDYAPDEDRTETDNDGSDSDVTEPDVSDSDISDSDVSSTDVPSSSDLPSDSDAPVSGSDIVTGTDVPQPDNTVTSDTDSKPEPVPNCAVLANGYNFADALAGVPFAAAADAPILLTNGTELRESVINELKRTGTERVYILGGDLAVSAAVEKKLLDLGFDVLRLAGATRYETACAIAKELEKLTGAAADNIFIAYGFNYPDALSAGAVAGMLGAPILYSSAEGTTDPATCEYIRNAVDADVTILGGTAAIASAAEKNFGALTKGSVTRISGSTRYATAYALCREYIDLFTGRNVILASGNDFPDALSGGSLACALTSPLLIINNQAHTDGLYELVKQLFPEKIYVLGGNIAVSDYVINTVLSGGSVTTTTTTTAPAAPVPGVRGDYIKRTATVRKNGTKVYSDCSTSSSVVATVNKNAKFSVLNEQPDSKKQYTWFEIKVGNKTGWICRTEVSVSNTFYSIPAKTFTEADKAVIYLSPSCQGHNEYATGKTTEQKEMEAVAKVIKQILDKEYDCITYIATSTMEITERPEQALSFGADIYVAIHSNATGDSSLRYGASSYYFPTCSQGKLLSQNLAAELNAIAPHKCNLASQVINGMTQFGGIGYAEVRDPSDIGMVAILAETEFHDHKLGSDWIRTHHNEIARAYVNALVKTFNIPKK